MQQHMRIKERIFDKSSIYGVLMILISFFLIFLFITKTIEIRETHTNVEATIKYIGRVKNDSSFINISKQQNIKVEYKYNGRTHEKFIRNVSIDETLNEGDIILISVDNNEPENISTSTSGFASVLFLIFAAILFLMGLFTIFIYY